MTFTKQETFNLHYIVGQISLGEPEVSEKSDETTSGILLGHIRALWPLRLQGRQLRLPCEDRTWLLVCSTYSNPEESRRVDFVGLPRVGAVTGLRTSQSPFTISFRRDKNIWRWCGISKSLRRWMRRSVSLILRISERGAGANISGWFSHCKESWSRYLGIGAWGSYYRFNLA